MSWITKSAVLFTVIAVVYCRRHYAGGRDGHYDEQGIYCNYYITDPGDGSKSIGSVLCRYGCCGLIDDQKCCSKDDSDEDDDNDNGGVSATSILVSLLAMGTLAVLISCSYWCYKRSKARRCKTNHNDRPRTTTRSAGRVPRGQRDPSAPPKYSLNPRPGHAAAPGSVYGLFTVDGPPPMYTPATQGPPAYQLPDLPPYSPESPKVDDKEEHTITSPPPPYSANLTD